MRGCVDYITSGKIGGWIFDPDHSAAKPQVRLLVGPQVIAESVADLPRPGVGQLLGTDGTHGFRFIGFRLSPEEVMRVAVEARSLPGDPWRPVGRRPGLRFLRRKPTSGAMRITVIGTSHIAALRYALPPEEDRFEIINLSLPRPGLTPVFPEKWREPNETYVRLFKASLDPNSHFVSMLGGNDHNALGLIEHPKRFDLLEPGREDAGIEDARELIPYDALRTMLEQRIGPYLQWLAALAPVFRGKKLHLCSPPPVPSAEHIRAHPGIFKNRLNRGVTPAPIRAKLYHVNSDIFRAGCAEIGMAFLPPPPASSDADGFLKPEYWNPDPTHANSHYGRLLVRQIEEHLAA